MNRLMGLYLYGLDCFGHDLTGLCLGTNVRIEGNPLRKEPELVACVIIAYKTSNAVIESN